MDRDVFVVESPTQLLNATEARVAFSCARPRLFVLMTGLFDRTWFARVANAGGWTDVRYVPFRFVARQYDFGLAPPVRFKERVIERLMLLDVMRKKLTLELVAGYCGDVRYLFLGQYRQDTHLHFRHFANVCRYQHLVLLDDGTDTALINRQRKEERRGRVDDGQQLPRGALKRAAKRVIATWDSRGAASLTFFTSMDITPEWPDRLIKNEYRHLKKGVRCIAVCKGTEGNDVGEGPSDAVDMYFLGQTLVDDGYLTMELYLECLSSVVTQNRSARLEYIPHPRESSMTVEQLRERLGIRVRRLDGPVELEVALAGKSPSIIAGFFCSALENLRAILPDDIEIHAYRIPSARLLQDHESVVAIYEHLSAAKGIRVKDV